MYETDTVTRIETNLDDCPAELLGAVMQRLLNLLTCLLCRLYQLHRLHLQLNLLHRPCLTRCLHRL